MLVLERDAGSTCRKLLSQDLPGDRTADSSWRRRSCAAPDRVVGTDRPQGRHLGLRADLGRVIERAETPRVCC